MASLNVFDHYSILEKKLNSNQTILIDKQTDNKVLMKQIVLSSLQEYRVMVQFLDNQKYIRHPYIVSLIDYHATVINAKGNPNEGKLRQVSKSPVASHARSPKSQSNHSRQESPHRKQHIQYRILALYEQSDHSLREQIQSRLETNSHFDQSQIWSILYSTAIGLSHLQKQGISHGCITTGDIFLNQDGMVRIVDPSLSTCAPFKQFVQDYYYSPEMLAGFNQQGSLGQDSTAKAGSSFDMFKCDIFSLSMCILQCCSLSSCSDCYTKKYQYACYDNYNTSYKQNQQIVAAIDTEKLKTKFNTLIGYYSKELLNLLYYGLAFSTQDRFDCIGLEKEISHILGPSFDYSQFRYSLGGSMSWHRQSTPNNLQQINETHQNTFIQGGSRKKLLPSRLDAGNQNNELYSIQCFQIDYQSNDINGQMNQFALNYNGLTQIQDEAQIKSNNLTTHKTNGRLQKRILLDNLEKFLFRERIESLNEQIFVEKQDQSGNQRSLFQNSDILEKNEGEKSSYLSLEDCINLQENTKINLFNQSNVIDAPKNGIENMSFQQIASNKVEHNQKIKSGDEIKDKKQVNDYSFLKKNYKQQRYQSDKQNFHYDNISKINFRMLEKDMGKSVLNCQQNFSINQVQMIESETNKQKQIPLRFQNQIKVQKQAKNNFSTRIDRVYKEYKPPMSEGDDAKPTQQIFTDPKLLEMMRVDMERILAKKANGSAF